MRLPERVSFYRGEGRKGLALLSASFIEADMLRSIAERLREA